MDLDDESIKNIELIKFKINRHQYSITGVLQDVISAHEHLQKLDKQLAEVTNNIDKITTAIDVIEIDRNQKTIDISKDTKNLDPTLSSAKISIINISEDEQSFDDIPPMPIDADKCDNFDVEIGLNTFSYREKTTISKFWTSCNKLSSILKDSIFGSNMETKKLTDSIDSTSKKVSQAKTEKDRLSITNAFANSLTVLLSPVLTLYVNAARTTEKTIKAKGVSSKTKELAKGILKTALIALSAPALPLISLTSKDARSRIQSNVEKYTSKLHYKHNNHETKL